jgi:hypothetical protein
MNTKGAHRTVEQRIKMSLAHIGKKHTEEDKIKMRKHRSEKCKESMRNKIVTEEHKRKIGESVSKSWTDERKKANALSHKGEKSCWWKGGIAYLPYPNEWTDDLRESVRKRDNYICQECGLHQDELKGIHKKLSVHHIDYNKDNLNPDNLITLCVSCHSKTNYNREYWINYFKKD